MLTRGNDMMLSSPTAHPHPASLNITLRSREEIRSRPSAIWIGMFLNPTL